MHWAGSVVDLSDRKPLAYAILERVVGPLIWQNEEWAQGQFDGCPIWIERGYVEGRHEKAFCLAVPTGRPITLRIHLRRKTSMVGQEVAIGDPAFRAQYIVAGAPAEVIREALDDDLRAWILRQWPGEDPPISVGFDGFVKLIRHMPSSHELRTGQARPILPEDIDSCARGLQRLASRLTEHFDGAYAAIARTRGEAIAAGWTRGLQMARQAEGARQDSIKRWFLFGVVVLVVVTLLLSFAFALWMVSL
jgi:hypothetical protein